MPPRRSARHQPKPVPFVESADLTGDMPAWVAPPPHAHVPNMIVDALEEDPESGHDEYESDYRESETSDDPDDSETDVEEYDEPAGSEAGEAETSAHPAPDQPNESESEPEKPEEPEESEETARHEGLGEPDDADHAKQG